MPVLTFDIPIRTVSEGNKRGCWQKDYARNKEQRDIACLFTQARLELPLAELPKSITLTRIAPRRLDTGNLAVAMKAVQDGICDALEINDGDRRIKWHYEQEKGKEYAVRVTLNADKNHKCQLTDAVHLAHQVRKDAEKRRKAEKVRKA